MILNQTIKILILNKTNKKINIHKVIIGNVKKFKKKIQIIHYNYMIVLIWKMIMILNQTKKIQLNQTNINMTLLKMFKKKILIIKKNN